MQIPISLQQWHHQQYTTSLCSSTNLAAHLEHMPRPASRSSAGPSTLRAEQPPHGLGQGHQWHESCWRDDVIHRITLSPVDTIAHSGDSGPEPRWSRYGAKRSCSWNAWTSSRNGEQWRPGSYKWLRGVCRDLLEYLLLFGHNLPGFGFRSVSRKNYTHIFWV